MVLFPPTYGFFREEIEKMKPDTVEPWYMGCPLADISSVSGHAGMAHATLGARVLPADTFAADELSLSKAVEMMSLHTYRVCPSLVYCINFRRNT